MTKRSTDSRAQDVSPEIADQIGTLTSSLERLHAQVEQLRIGISEAGTLALGDNGLQALRIVAADKGLRIPKSVASFHLIGRILLGVDGGLSSRFASFAQAIYRPSSSTIEANPDRPENKSAPTSAAPFTGATDEPRSKSATTAYAFTLPKNSSAGIAELLDAEWRVRERGVFAARKIRGDIHITRWLGTYDRSSQTARLEVKARRRKGKRNKNAGHKRRGDW